MEDTFDATSIGPRTATGTASPLKVRLHCDEIQIRKIITLLMGEHRMIEALLGIMHQTAADIAETGRADPAQLFDMAGFMREFTEQCHQSKEEQVLFRELFCRELTADHRRVLDQAINEHAVVHRLNSELRHHAERYQTGYHAALDNVAAVLRELLALCPAHMAQEELYIGDLIRSYFTSGEKQSLLERYKQSDHDIVHQGYRSRLDALNVRRSLPPRPALT